MSCRVACVLVPVVGALSSSVYIRERLRTSDSAPVDNPEVIYSPQVGISPDGRAYRKYIVGTTTMFRSVEVNKPQRITVAIGV